MPSLRARDQILCGAKIRKPRSIRFAGWLDGLETCSVEEEVRPHCDRCRRRRQVPCCVVISFALHRCCRHWNTERTGGFCIEIRAKDIASVTPINIVADIAPPCHLPQKPLGMRAPWI